MKKEFLAFAIGILAMLTACNKDEISSPENENSSVTFNLKCPIETRSLGSITRYVVEVYDGSTILEHIEYGAVPQPIVLTKNKMYTFLFWADYGTPSPQVSPSLGDYNVSNLKQVYISAPNFQASYEAFCGKATFKVSSNDRNTSSYTITLNRAIAKVVFTQANEDFTTDNNTLAVTYPASYAMDVSTGIVSEDNVPFTQTFTGIPKASANKIIASSYVFNQLGINQKLYTLHVKFNSENEKVINNVPMRQNSITTITGPYSNLYISTFNISNTVDSWTDENTGMGTDMV